MSDPESERAAALKRLEEEGARFALGRGERVLVPRAEGFAELTLGEDGQLVETPRPDLTRGPSPVRRLFRRLIGR